MKSIGLFYLFKVVLYWLIDDSSCEQTDDLLRVYSAFAHKVAG